MFDHDLLADLPAPRDDEPASLRADIADELADHLRCAFRREVFKDGDETAAQQRVLDRFGDPKKLARRLWRQAMWSLIMRQRILSGVQWLVSLTAVVLAGAVFWQQSQIWQELRTARQEEAVQRQALMTALNQLQAVSGPPAVAHEEAGARVAEEPFLEPGRPLDGGPDERLAAPGPAAIAPAEKESPPSLTVKFVQEKADGPVVSPKYAELAGDDTVFLPGEAGRSSSIHESAAKVPLSLNHQAVYGPLKPGRYELKVTLADGQNTILPVLIRDEKPQDLTVVCPSPRRTATVLVTMPPLPEDLREVVNQLKYSISARPMLVDGVTWQPPPTNTQALSFDPKTGETIGVVVAEETNLRNAKPEDRVVFVPEGPAGVRFSLGFYRKSINVVVHHPQPAPEDEWAFLPRTVEPGENRWSVDLPQEFLAQARRVLQQSNAYFDPYSHPRVVIRYAEDSPPKSTYAEDSPPKSTAPPQLALKLVQETGDGPLANVDHVHMESRKTLEVAEQQGPPDARRFFFQTLAPDHYNLTVRLKDGQECTRPLLVRDKPQELTMVCPGPRKETPVLMTLPPLPEELQKRNFQVKVHIVAGPLEIGQNKWYSRNFPPQDVTFDRATGLPTAIETMQEGTQRRFDLSELPADERSVFLPVGTVNYSFSAAEVLAGPGSVPLYLWPTGSWLTQTVAADRQAWKVELPREYIKQMFAPGGTDPLSPARARTHGSKEEGVESRAD